jgi:hypothetical protein
MEYVDKESGIKVGVNPEAIRSPEQAEAISEMMATLMGVEKETRPPIKECVKGWDKFDKFVGELVDIHYEILEYYRMHPCPHAEIIFNYKSMDCESSYDIKHCKDIVRITINVGDNGGE